MRIRYFVSSLWLTAALAAGAAADPRAPGAMQRNEFASCRAVFLRASSGEFVPQREYFILIDRTIQLDTVLGAKIAVRAARAVQPGDRVRIISFSALTQSNFTTDEFFGDLDREPSEDELENDIPARLVGAARKCFSRQRENARNKLRDTLEHLLATPAAETQRSQIMMALSNASRSLLRHTRTRKIMLVVSDMLENSDIISFYRGGALDALDVDRAMALARRSNLLGDFSGATLFVAGAAAVPPDGPVRTVKARQRLYAFWEKWFVASKGEMPLASWGDPDLVNDIE